MVESPAPADSMVGENWISGPLDSQFPEPLEGVGLLEDIIDTDMQFVADTESKFDNSEC